MKDHKNDPPVHNIFKQIAATPDRSSYIWKDGRPSIIATIVLWTIWFVRLFSILQLIKFFIRLPYNIRQINNQKREKADNKAAVFDNGSKRPNIPPWLPELYFLVWTIIMVVLYFLQPGAPIFQIITYYYLGESIIWVTYYTIFRRFFEEKYALYHALENLVILIILFLSQMFAFTYLLRNVEGIENSLMQNLLGLLGAGWDKTHPAVKLCGAFNAAIVIGMIITNFPSERTKSEIDNEHFIVIGNGDVVEKRLYPALKKAKFKDKYIEIYDLKANRKPTPYDVQYLGNNDKIAERIRKRVNGRSIIFLCSPSYIHYEYIELLYQTNYCLFVIEKPIETDTAKLEDIKQTIIEKPELRNKFFFLSYYCLEKALPLTYLVKRNEEYLKYLYISDVTLLNNIFEKLGSFKSIDVTIEENDEIRPWASDPRYGGQLTETFIHNVLIATLFVGEPKYWNNTSLNIEQGYKKIELTASGAGGSIHLLQSKSSADVNKERKAIIVYENGVINADFDKQNLNVTLNNGQTLTIAINNAFKDKYDVQVDLVRRVYDGDINSKDVDGLGLQIETIEWLIEKNNEYIDKNK